MKNIQAMLSHSLHKFEADLKYFRSLVSTQAEPFRYIGISIAIEERIAIIMRYIRQDGEKVSDAELDFAFALLNQFLDLWQLYFKNHPLRISDNHKK